MKISNDIFYESIIRFFKEIDLVFWLRYLVLEILEMDLRWLNIR